MLKNNYQLNEYLTYILFNLLTQNLNVLYFCRIKIHYHGNH